MTYQPDQIALQISPAKHKEVRDGAQPTAGRQTLYRRVGKRAFDAIAAALGLVTSSPLILICARAVRVGSSGPIFFRQRRVGQCGKPFEIIKFRTMVHRAEDKGLGITAEGDARVNGTGKWLRELKLDELPQLLNVLKGDMSLVGPRPEVPRYVAAYTIEQLQVLGLKPGITGLASLAYLNEEKLLADQPDKEAFYLHTLMPQKLELDLSYSKRVSFFNDLRLILATVRKLFHIGNGTSHASTPILPAGSHEEKAKVSRRSLLSERTR